MRYNCCVASDRVGLSLPSSSLLLPVQGGIYMFQLMDQYAAVVSLMFLAFFEVAAVCWVFGKLSIKFTSSNVWFFWHLSFIPFASGVSRISLMIERMLGKAPNIYFRLCWKFFSPVLVLVRF